MTDPAGSESRRGVSEMICPRCGQRYSGSPALSRHVPVDICSDCGTDEAMRGFLGMPTMRLDDWYSPPARSA